MIRLNNIKKIYNQNKENEFEALHQVSVTINNGEMIAVMGKSGAGKSTLLHIIGCIDSYEDGEYYIDALLVKDLSEKRLAEIRNSKIGIVMQDFALIEEFTSIDNIMLPLDFSNSKKTNKEELAQKALECVDLADYGKKPVKLLSGGQKQRVAIARAIVNDPDIIIADEPTGALDTKTSDEIMDLFNKLNKMGKTIIIVTHDPIVAEKCNRKIIISDGDIVE